MPRTGGGLIATRLCTLELRVGGVERGLADKALLLQITGTVKICLRVAQLGLRLRTLRLAALHAGLRLTVVNGGEQLARAHLVTGLDQQRGDAATGLCRDRALLDRLNRAIKLKARRH